MAKRFPSPLLDQVEWVARFAEEMVRLGTSIAPQGLKDRASQLWKTYGPMRPEDVAAFEHSVLAKP
jgi:hypothetical protein